MGFAPRLLQKQIVAFLICWQKFCMRRGRRGFAFSMRCIIDTAQVTTRLGSTLRQFRRQPGRT